MFKIRRGDIVFVKKGVDRGKKGKVLQMLTEKARALVEGINLAKKHKRKTREDQQGGIVSIEKPISVSNLALFCKNCNRAARVGFKVSPEGGKFRFCKSCKETI